MLAVTDPYKILQVDPDAEPEVIRAAYRALALRYHPDKVTGSQERMAILNQAWEILRTASSRAAYDQARRMPEPPKSEAPKPETSYAMPAPLPPTPPGRPSGSVLDFGRYAGWSLGQLVTVDPGYLEWLARTPIGRSLNREIHALLATHAAASTAGVATAERRSRRFRRS